MNLKFKPITLSDMPLIWRYLKIISSRSCDYSFGGILMWVDYYNYEYCIVDDVLYVKGNLSGISNNEVFALPVGNKPLEIMLSSLKSYCEMKNIALTLSAVPEDMLDDVSALQPKDIVEISMLGDYIYDASSLATLSGRKYSKKRNHVNNFIFNYGRICYESISESNISEIKDFMSNIVYCGLSSEMSKKEFQMSNKILDIVCSDENPMFGGVLKVGDKVEAYSIGDIKGDTLYVHIEKANKKIKGAYEVINMKFAEDILSRYPDIKYINREDDAGEEGLRKAKLSYHPITILKKFNVIF